KGSGTPKCARTADRAARRVQIVRRAESIVEGGIGAIDVYVTSASLVNEAIIKQRVIPGQCDRLVRVAQDHRAAGIVDQRVAVEVDGVVIPLKHRRRELE